MSPSSRDICSVAVPNNYQSKISIRVTPGEYGRAYRSERHDGNETEGEAVRGIPVGVVRDRAERHKDEEDVEPRAKEEVSERVQPSWFSVGGWVGKCGHTLRERPRRPRTWLPRCISVLMEKRRCFACMCREDWGHDGGWWKLKRKEVSWLWMVLVVVQVFGVLARNWKSM